MGLVFWCIWLKQCNCIYVVCGLIKDDFLVDDNMNVRLFIMIPYALDDKKLAQFLKVDCAAKS